MFNRRPNPVSCRLPADERAAVFAPARRRGTSVSALIKEALQPHINEVDRRFTAPPDLDAPQLQSVPMRSAPLRQSAAAAFTGFREQTRGGFTDRLK